jgi:hypothetical protein
MTTMTPALPTFSLLHATARLPDGWKPAWLDWSRKCVNKREVEYILVTDSRDANKGVNLTPPEGCCIPVEWILNMGRPCTVDAWNTAARMSTGHILVVVADDWFPCDCWDEALRRAIPDMTKEVCVWPAGEVATAGLMICPILTRAYYARPGRGGHPNGELFYPDYISVGSDDDFTEVALRDGVVVRIPEVFEHRHPYAGLASDDEVYRWSNRQEAWNRKTEVQARRRACGYSR